jgi:hypothetical protein
VLTGTEPVQEAASRYYRPRPGHDLPAVSLAPDVLLDGLSFAGAVSGQVSCTVLMLLHVQQI